MNKVELLGRLTKDVDVRYSQGENSMCIAKIAVAVDRKFKRDGEPTADFINCIAFGKQGEVIEKYFKKGSRIALCGHIQTGSYTNREGNKVYTTDVVIDEFDFVDSKSQQNDSNSMPNTEGFVNIPDGIDDQIPFS